MKPFIKRRGNKNWALWNITEKLNEIKDFASLTYVEPFLGGGAVALSILQNHTGKVILSDINEELINAWIQVRDNVNEVIENLHSLSERDDAREYSMIMLCRTDEEISKAEKASAYIFLHKPRPKIDFHNIENVSRALKGCIIQNTDYHYTIPNAVYYLDPPIEKPKPDSYSFFKSHLATLHNMGCKILVSNLDGWTCPGFQQRVIRISKSGKTDVLSSNY